MEYVLGDILYAGPQTLIIASTHPVSGLPIALKRPREAVPSARLLDKLRHEYAMLGEAQGPDVVRPVELLSAGNSVTIVMERWGTGSLDRLLENGPLPLRTALRLGAALARALGAVHRKGLLHRDIKPH